MIKLYLKQAWTLIKQHRLFTGIYVVVHYFLCEVCAHISRI